MTIVQIDGVYNARDVGGLPAADGVVREGVLLRSGNLAAATAAGVAALRERVGRIVDLRDEHEVATQPSAQTGIVTTHLPLFLGSVSSFFENDVSLDGLYAHLLEESGERLAEAVRVIAAGERTLVHCTVGKDRTGVTVALALAAVGVDRDAIVADYALTASQLPEERNRRIIELITAEHPESQHAISLATQSPAPIMRSLLAHVDERWGSAAGYLQDHGLTTAERDELQKVLIAP